MKTILKWLGLVVAAVVFVFVLQIVASESGEVVVLTTYDANDVAHETRVWVVDHKNVPWLRSGSPEATWFKRLAANPKIRFVRGTDDFEASAQPVENQRDVINNLMGIKYGWADAYIGVLFGRDDAVPVRITLIRD